MEKRQHRKISVGNILIYVIVTVITLICLYPFLYIVASSMSSTDAVLSGKVTIYPIGFQLDAYKRVFEMNQLWMSFKVTAGVVIFGTSLELFLTISTAYALSKERLKGRKIINAFILFTMYFSAGIIPTFIVVRNLGLYNTFAALILPDCLSVFNIIIMRTFFRGIPNELEEAALIDGAGDITILTKIILPISKPIIATVGLFVAVAYWNDYLGPLMYTQKEELYTLQLRLRSLLMGSGLSNAGAANLMAVSRNAMPLIMKRAVIVVSTLPIMLIYPWVQKYFVKGVMLGSVKG